MGDLRNKFRKQEQQEAIAAMQRRLAPARAAEPLPRCACGHTWMEAQLWAVPAGRDGAARFCCTACAPADLLAVISAGK